MKKLPIFITALFAFSFALFAAQNPFDEMSLKGVTDKANPVGYAIGEPIIFTLRTENLAQVPKDNKYRVRWKRTGDDGIVKEGESPLVVGETCVVTTKMDRAGFVRLEAHVVAGGGYWVLRSKNAPGSPAWDKDRSIFFDGGAGVAVDKIEQEFPEPKDLDAYWKRRKAELAKVPITAERKDQGVVDGCRVYAVTVACTGPRPVTGYLFIPENAKPKSCRVRVGFHGYGANKHERPDYAAAMCVAKGEIFFDVNAHGFELDREKNYYTEFAKKINTSGRGYAFNAKENADPDTCYFYGMSSRAIRAVEYAKTLSEWNGKDLVASGTSQGGLQTSWVASLDLGVTLAQPCVTWGCDFGMPEGPRKRLHESWFIPYGKGLDYYDTINHIRRAKCPIEITRAGLGDYVCPPSGLAAYFNAIPGRKSINWVQGSRHCYVPVGENQAIKISH